MFWVVLTVKVHKFLFSILFMLSCLIFVLANKLLQPWIGKGCVFTYDAVGSYERVGYSSQGSGSTLIMPFLDNQLKSPSPLLLPAKVKFSSWWFACHVWFLKFHLTHHIKPIISCRMLLLHCLKRKQLSWSKLFLLLQLREIYTQYVCVIHEICICPLE
jgi:hypothetical protein